MSYLKNLTAQDIRQRLARWKKFIVSIEAHHLASENFTVMLLEVTQLGIFMLQGVYYISSSINDAVQLKLKVWRLNLEAGLIYTPHIFETMNEKRRPNKKVRLEQGQRIYQQFIGFEGLGLTLMQNTHPRGRIEWLGLGLFPLVSVTFSVWAMDDLSRLSISFSILNMSLESSATFMHISEHSH